MGFPFNKDEHRAIKNTVVGILNHGVKRKKKRTKKRKATATKGKYKWYGKKKGSSGGSFDEALKAAGVWVGK